MYITHNLTNSHYFAIAEFISFTKIGFGTFGCQDDVSIQIKYKLKVNKKKAFTAFCDCIESCFGNGRRHRNKIKYFVLFNKIIHLLLIPKIYYTIEKSKSYIIMETYDHFLIFIEI